MTEVDVDGLSIQERLYPDLPCFGCGHGNPKGLRLRSYPGDAAVVATFLPWPEHDNGLGFLNGGIISTVLDCHSAAAVMLEADVEPVARGERADRRRDGGRRERDVSPRRARPRRQDASYGNGGVEAMASALRSSFRRSHLAGCRPLASVA